jgi:hypothetical protein
VWPFNRKAQTPAPSGPQPVPAPVIRRDWAGLPPIQRSIGEHPLTAPSDRFSDDLATHHDPSVSSDQMGHQVSAEAPPGLVLALVRPTTRSDGPAMIPRPRVQRRVDGAVAQSGEWDGDEAAPVEARSSPLPAGVQRTAIVERPVVTPVADQPLLTALAPDVDPLPLTSKPQRAAAPMSFDMPLESTSGGRDHQPAPRLTLGQARRLGLGAPINKVPDRSVQRSAVEPTQPPPTILPSPSPSLMSDSLSESAARSETDTMLASATPTTGSPRLELPLAPTRSTTDSSSESTSAQPDLPVSRSSAIPAANVSNAGISSSARPTAPPLTVQATPVSDELQVSEIRSATGMPLPLQRHGGVPSATPASALARTAVVPETAAMAPLVGVRQIATLQRSVTDSAAPAEQPRTPPASSGEPDDSNGDFDLAIEPGPRGLPMIPSDLRLPVLVPSIQRLPAGTVEERPATPLTLAPQPREMSARWADEGPARRDAAGATNFPLAPAPAIIQRIAADESRDQTAWATVAEPSLQRAPAEAPAVGEAPAGVAVGPSAAASPNGTSFHAPADSHAAEGDMDALAGKLYDRIRSRLKTELLVDRERAGFLTDLR